MDISKRRFRSISYSRLIFFFNKIFYYVVYSRNANEWEGRRTEFDNHGVAKELHHFTREICERRIREIGMTESMHRQAIWYSSNFTCSNGRN